MSNNLIKQKNKEKIYNEKYFEIVYSNKPNYLHNELDIPDYYVESKEVKFAIELTTYFMQEDEQKIVVLKRTIAKLLEKNNWLYEAYKHIGKVKEDTIKVHYKHKKDMIEDVLKAKDYIKHIRIGNNAWFYTKNRINCYLMSNNRQELELEEFLKYINFVESDEKYIYIELIKNNKYNFSTELIYNRYTLNNKEKCIDYSYIYWENEEKQYNSLKKSIDKKLNKYEQYTNKLSMNNISYDKYILIIYPEQYPLDIENFDELYIYLKKQIKNLRYDEIGIFLFNKVFVLRDTQYIVYDI